jgi:hypothetical protein
VATIDTVSELASFERRGAGSDAERRAARWLAGELTTGGLDTTVETFWCRPNSALAHAWHVALALAGSLVSTSAPHVGIALLTVALLSVIADAVTGRSPGRRLTPERASQNVIATSTRTTASTRLILTAGYDAGRTGLANGLRAPRLLGWLGWLCLGIVWLLAVAAVRAGGHDGTAVDVVQLVPSVALVIVLALLLEAAGSPPAESSADTAGATAVALAIARALDAAPPRQLSVELVLQGGGGIGLRRYLRARRGQLRPDDTVVVGIAPSGTGPPRWWRSDGPLLPLRYSIRLAQLCADVAADQPHLHATPHAGRTAGPAFPARQRHLPAITIGCLEKRSRPADGLDGTALDRVTQFGLILVDAIDAFLARRSAQPEAPAAPTPA